MLDYLLLVCMNNIKQALRCLTSALTNLNSRIIYFTEKPNTRQIGGCMK